MSDRGYTTDLPPAIAEWLQSYRDSLQRRRRVQARIRVWRGRVSRFFRVRPDAARCRFRSILHSLEGGRGKQVLGTVKKWVADRGFGFITPAAGGHDVFVHVSGLVGMTELKEGQRVSFEEEPDHRRGKLRAVDVRAA
jgi:cold shock protein